MWIPPSSSQNGMISPHKPDPHQHQTTAPLLCNPPNCSQPPQSITEVGQRLQGGVILEDI